MTNGRKESLLDTLSNEKFTSKHIIDFKCPTCHLAWRDCATSSRLFQPHDKKLYHVDCNEFVSGFYYKEVYPNLAKIYDEQVNEIKFDDLTLNYNVTIPINWRCDKCDDPFELSIERLLKRIKRNGTYCETCEASFKDLNNEPNEEAPLSFLTPELIEEWSNDNMISAYQVDILSDIEITWSCSECNGAYSCKVYERDNRSCPYCNGYKKLKNYNTLNITHPYLKDFWSSSNQNALHDYWQYDKELVIWICPCCSIEFECSPLEIISRTTIENQNFQTCPKHCNWFREIFKDDFLAEYPKLLDEWSERNQIPIYSAATHIETQKYWWTCSNCHGEYQCSIPIRKETKDSCPYCNNETPMKGFNTLLDVYPELAAMWKTENNVDIDTIIPNGIEKRRFAWHCNTCQHDFEEHLNILLSRYLSTEKPNLENVCPNCTEIKEISKTESFLEEYPELEKEWDVLNNILMPNPKSLTVSSKIKVWWICLSNQEHRYKLSVRDRIRFKTRSKEPCNICKGLRRKREHFVPFEKF